MSDDATMDSENATNSNFRMTRSRATNKMKQNDSNTSNIKKTTTSSSSLATSTFDNLKLNKKLNETEQKIKDKIKRMQPILSNHQLKNLDEHKYSSNGITLLDPLFQPYWRWLVEQMPIWLAPNAITVIGLIINVITSTILIFYSPNATEHVYIILLEQSTLVNHESD